MGLFTKKHALDKFLEDDVFGSPDGALANLADEA